VFRRNILPPSSGAKNKLSKKPGEAGSKFCFEIHSIQTQKTIFYLVTTVRSLNPMYYLSL
jgi:hypothetical protein